MNKICLQCNNEFIVKISTLGKYCSRKCHDKDRKFNDNDINESIKKRLHLNSKLNETNGCVEWQKYKNSKGYGKIMISKGKPLLTHRASWIVSNGEIPIDKLILHSCDNPSCINILHLFIGTASQNTEDMMRKGRHKKVYTKNNRPLIYPGSKLSLDQVKKIKGLLITGLTSREISKITESSISSVNDIRRNKTWKHIDNHIIIKTKPRHKLTEEQVKEVKKMMALGLREVDICRKLKISRCIVEKIRKNKTWKHIKI